MRPATGRATARGRARGACPATAGGGAKGRSTQIPAESMPVGQLAVQLTEGAVLVSVQEPRNPKDVLAPAPSEPL